MQKGKDLKPHIGIFGRRNNGKSSFINRITGQDVAIVSEVAGTTTDPVKKSVEIFGVGPAIIVDTAGVDDVGELGSKRVQKTMDVLNHIDLAVLLLSENNFGSFEQKLITEFNRLEVPYVIFHNKADQQSLLDETRKVIARETLVETFDISVLEPGSLEFVTEKIKKAIPQSVYMKPALFDGLLKPKDLVLLITPIDSEAPEGRMILPQVMAWRDVLDHHCVCVTVRETELKDFMGLGLKPALAVTDSQAFGLVSKLIPNEIPLTGFSIVFARMRANFDKYIEGTPKLSELQNGDRVLLLESCTHHVSCEDIGRYKLPSWIQSFSGKEIEFDVVAGLDQLKRPVTDYAMVIQCGGCVVTQKQLKNRLKPAIDSGVPVSNYGMAIAYMNGIFERAIRPFINLNSVK
ncbi:MAG: [FeFe] hydrogenase H-cluster maturation GTPase HydF [Bacteroidales bacterium]|nr:[FeFe] hydrogenase H-cluster maturation GTPase HydF [Bacteroidales bacterium]